MMKPIITLFLALLLALPVVANQPVALPDSLLTIDNIYNYTFSDYDKAVRIATAMRQRKALNTFQLDIAEGDLYFNNGKYHQGLKHYLRAMDSDSVKLNDERLMNLMHRMISTYDCMNNATKKAQYIEMLLQKAQAVGDPVMESIARFNMGKMLYYQKDKERGYNLIHQAIDLMENSDYEYRKDNLIYDYNSLYIMQQMDEDFPAALKTLDKLAAVIAETDDADYQMEGIHRKELKTMYAHRAYVLAKLGRKQEADDTYRKWKDMGSINDKDNHLIISYLLAAGQYDEAIRIDRQHEDFRKQNNDTVNYHMRAVTRRLGRAHAEKGDYKTASEYFYRMAILTDSLKTREQQSAALELATVYETLEKEAEIQQKTADLRLRNILLASATLLILLLTILLWRNLQYARTIRRKNLVMAKTINQLMEYKEERRERRAGIKRKAETEATALTNKELFSILDETVVNNRLYLDRHLTREDLMRLIGVDKNRFGQIMTQEAQTNITGYLNSLRLEYAIQLFRENPDISINEVCDRVAIPNISTFYRLFKEKYGMTPIEFRKVM